MKIILYFIVTMLSLLTSFDSYASKACSNLFTAEVQSQNNSKKQLNSLVDGIAKFVDNAGRIPAEREIADAVGVHETVVSAFLAKKASPDIPALVAIAKQSHPEVFKTYEARLAKKAAEYLEENLSLPTTKQLAEALDVSEKDVVVIYGGNKDIFLRISEYERKTLDRVTDILIKTYVKAAREYGRSATAEEVAGVQGSKFTLETLNSFIGKGRLINDINDLFKMAELKNPKSLKGVVDLEIYNDQKYADLMKDLKEGERLVITSSIAGAPVNKEFLGALKTYNKIHNAPLFVKPINNETGGLDPVLHNESFVHVLISEIKASSDMLISNIPIMAKQINPLSGLLRLGQRGVSFIVGSPKMHLEVAATKDNALRPHIALTTGSMNDSDVYQGKKLMSGRTDYIAEHDHVMGAIILEKTAAQDDLVGGTTSGTYHIRHIRYDSKKRGFMDLNKFYTAEGVKEDRIAAVGFGDTHVAQTDHKLAYQTRRQIMEEFKPEVAFIHDWLDGQSISHYERDKVITLAQKAARGQLHLKDELDISVDYLKGMLDAAPADTVLVIVDANHNAWPIRYLESGQFMKEPHNTVIGLELAKILSDGKNPLEYYVEKSLGTKYARRILFLKPGERNLVGSPENSVDMSEHGDKGANGAKGSIGSFVRGLDNGAFGHTHTVRINNLIMNIGTNSVNPSSYAKGGFSNWVQGLVIVGQNGDKQLLIFKNGEWYRDTSRPLPPPEDFFEEGYPAAKPHNKPTEAVQMDQYSR